MASKCSSGCLNVVKILKRRAIFSESQSIWCFVCLSFIFMLQCVSGRDHGFIHKSIVSQAMCRCCGVCLCLCKAAVLAKLALMCAKPASGSSLGPGAQKRHAFRHANRSHNPTCLQRVTHPWPMRQPTKKWDLFTVRKRFRRKVMQVEIDRLSL